MVHLCHVRQELDLVQSVFEAHPALLSLKRTGCQGMFWNVHLMKKLQVLHQSSSAHWCHASSLMNLLLVVHRQQLLPG
jgi:hypothetical protein